MANKKEPQLSSIQANKFIAELPAKREKIAASVQFRHGLLGIRKRVNYQSEFDRLRGAKTILGLHPNVKPRMKELQQKKATLSLEGGGTQAIYKTSFSFIP